MHIYIKKSQMKIQFEFVHVCRKDAEYIYIYKLSYLKSRAFN